MKRQQSSWSYESSEMGTNNRLSGGPEKAEAPKMSDGDARNKDLDAEPEKEKRTLASDDYTQKQKIGVCVMYAATSIAISMCYKTVLSTFHFEAEFLLLACQQILGILFCLFAQRFMNDYKMVRVPQFDWNTFKQSLPVGTLFVFNIGVGFFAIRRTTTIFTLMFEFFILGNSASRRVIGSVLVIVIGTIVAGWHTFNTEYLGYFFTICNNILTALYLNMSRRFGDSCGVKGFGLVYYNALVAVPLSLFMSFILGEFEYAANFPDLFKPTFIGGMLFSAVLGIMMTYIVMLCASVNSPVVTSITGNVKDILSTVLGALLFGFDATVSNVIGLIISFAGAGLFTYSKMVEKGEIPAAGDKKANEDEDEESEKSRLVGRRDE